MFDEIDNLTYTYNGNQLIKVDDSAQEPIYKDCFDFKDGADEDIEYEYDANGNMTKDLNHGICNIEYNCINLPSRVDFLDGSRVLYTYDAKGTKLRTDYYINPMSAVVPQTTNEQGASSATNLRHTWTDYCGNFIYENDTLKQTLIEGGYISYEYPQNTAVTSISQLAPTYHFYVQDHLGNNRLVVDEGGTIEQINNYYPFGTPFYDEANTTNASLQPFKYNGKELDMMHGLNTYDYGARQYNPVTLRWDRIDPLCEKYYSISPYVYCANNPVNRIDPNGKVVIASDENARRNIINTLNASEAKYVQFDKNGILNHDLLAKYDGYSENLSALKALSESSTNYFFQVSDKDINGKSFFEKGTDLNYPNNYSYGVTNLPGAENDPSPNENVYIFTASFLDERIQARNTAHEGYGHAYFYELSKKDPSINPNHTRGKIGVQKEYDPEFKMELVIPIFGKTNIKLEQQISIVEQQALKNYDERNN
jgi:RHS repeat-associated protein